MAKHAAPRQDPDRLIAENRKARHRFDVLETIEAGLVLRGSEVKTLRDGKGQLDEAYARIEGGEAWLVGAYIDEYTHGNRQNHTPTRRRKLLLRKAQINKLESRVKQKVLTLVPLKLYFSERGHAKLLLGVCRGRKTFDKRQVAQSRDARREMRQHE